MPTIFLELSKYDIGCRGQPRDMPGFTDARTHLKTVLKFFMPYNEPPDEPNEGVDRPNL